MIITEASKMLSLLSNRECPIKNSSTFRAHSLPSLIAQTTRDCPGAYPRQRRFYGYWFDNFFQLLLHFLFHLVQLPTIESILHVADEQIPLPVMPVHMEFLFHFLVTSTN